MAESSVSWPELVQQAEFHKEVHGWVEAIAGAIGDDDQLFFFLSKSPISCRMGLYNILKPRLRFQPKPWYLYRFHLRGQKANA